MNKHVVRSGETLSSIATRYSVNAQELQTKNGISNPKHLQPGHVLLIPSNRIRQAAASPEKPKKSSKQPAKANSGSAERHEHEGQFKFKWISFEWLDELLERLRAKEADEHIQKSEKVQLTPQDSGAKPSPAPAAKKSSKGSKKISEVTEKIKETLNKEPHVVTFSGVRLTENERKQIVAAVACCEMNADGFGSVNPDTEFIGRKFGKKGIETGYSRIVHIGLSYGVIQYTQDSGNIGILLKKLQEKNSSKFVQIFGGGNKEIAQSLITLTSDGRPDLRGDNSIPLCGQAYWEEIRATAKGKEMKTLSEQDKDGDGKSDLPAHREIRGKRVQPIPANPSEMPTDIWTGTWKQRFLEAGNELDFQEAQLDCAVEMFFNPIIGLAKKNKVRSALGLAFVTACAVRGGTKSKLATLIYRVAGELGVTLPFENSEDETRCVKAVADADGKVGKVKFHKEESKRARLLLEDKLGFLAEDLYDLSTY
ncbi:LysM peptidoglycan-binding domain-containing protein [Noviherbaspirillum sp. ST9]|uniref:LysM peptidoglycan-binding domain-containing protein n=1 Tax=Noviherbaspirillum sp. ST9 TaxID=3401606 RepID=UPI003B58667F